MQTSGIVIHLALDRFDSAAEAGLRARADLCLGGRVGCAWPAVLEASGARASIDAVRALEHEPGIARVDVVFVGTP